jgi:hypothetical protein
MGFTPDNQRAEPEEWVLWNPALGIVVMVTLGRVETGEHGRLAWMLPPYAMVGPFNFDELQAEGRITFAACVVMSRRRWQQDQVNLRREAQHERRRKHASDRDDRSRRRPLHHATDERRHRQTLNLPAEGTLKPAQIKAAYRRVALRAHPDSGGDHELFIRVTQARDVLLNCGS